MPMSDEEEAKLKKELEDSKRQLHEMLAKAKTEDGEKAKEKDRNASPGKVTLDPDVVKEMQAMKMQIAALEKKLGSGGASFDFLDMFKTK